ncbi:MAG TPA: VanW family protein [Acidimicrobiia bacterium]|jgi:vancomycin resistance protein YoaR|nr:VanW family protein [Acidimicrobiia bacterium]
MTALVDPPEPAARAKMLQWQDVAWVAAVFVVVLLFLGVAERIAYRGRVMPGVKIDSLDISGQRELPAYASIQHFEKNLARKPIRGVADGHTLVADPTSLHLHIDARATVRRAREDGRSRNPIAQVSGTILRHIRPDHIDPVVSFDTHAADAIVDRWSAQVDSGVQEGGLEFTGTTVVPVEPRSGMGIDRDDARLALVTELLDGDRAPFHLAYGRIPARTTPAQVAAAATKARAILSHPLTVSSSGHTFAVTPAQIATALVTHVDGGDVVLDVDRARLATALQPQLDTIGTPPVDARFEVTSDNHVVVVPSQNGLEPDLDAIAHAIVANRSTVSTSLATRHPAHDTTWANKLGITEEVSSFTTHYIPGQTRVTNIHRAADIMSNTVVPPGGVFSLNGVLGARTPERGFVKAPVYYEGEAEDYGGGVSQIATTTYNAAFWGGYHVIFHKPHSVYYSRYPLGREATVNYPILDLKWQNNSQHGVLVRASYSSSSVTVTLYGNKEGKVVAEESANCRSTDPYTRCVDILKQTPFTTQVVQCPPKDPKLDPANECPSLQPGQTDDTASGHTAYQTQLFRVIDQPGHPEIRERITWSYTMTPDIVLVGATPPGVTTTTKVGAPTTTAGSPVRPGRPGG